MARLTRRQVRIRLGRVSCYQHHGSWHVYYRDNGRPIRQRIGAEKNEAIRAAAEVNARLTSALPGTFSFVALSIEELRQRFLDHHELVAHSSLATVSRYRAATQHLVDYIRAGKKLRAHELDGEAFAIHLRKLWVSPNGHPNSARRPLREKGIRFILETCRAMYAYAAKRRHLPPYAENPFAGIGSKQRWSTDRKPIFVFDQNGESNFFQDLTPWFWPLQFLLAKTGLRPGEAVHLLIEDLDLPAGWLKVCNKPELGWCSKTRRERSVPLIQELVDALHCVIGNRRAGPVFLRPKFCAEGLIVAGAGYRQLAGEIERRIRTAEAESTIRLSDARRARICRSVWQEAGAVSCDGVRTAFIQQAQIAGFSHATCPKSWRHTFATLLQDANVDPLIRQLTLGHSPTVAAIGGLGMTTLYTHTRPETQRQEILRALRTWPQPLALAVKWCKEVNHV
jgi:integrase